MRTGNGQTSQHHHSQHQQQQRHHSKTEQLMQRRQKSPGPPGAVQAVAVLNPGNGNSVNGNGSKETALNLRCLWVGWVFMCWISGMMTAAGFLLPYWLKGSRQASDFRRQLSDLGLFRLCAYPRQVDGQVKLVMDCGHYRHFAEIPSALWKLAFVLMATSCCLLLLLTFFLAFTGFRLFILRIRPVVAICGAAQGCSSLFVLLSCLLYPAGWQGNPDVAQVCGSEADAFSLGRCHLGWAYVLTCAGGFLCGVTVAFPAQIAKHFPEELAVEAVEQSAPVVNGLRSPCRYRSVESNLTQADHYSHQQQPSPQCTGSGRYNYIVYHSLQPTPQHQQHQQQQQQQQLSRPPSVCTCAMADCHSTAGSVAAASAAAAAAAAAAASGAEDGDGGSCGGDGGGAGGYLEFAEDEGEGGVV